MSDKATLRRLLREHAEAISTEIAIIKEDAIVRLFDAVRDEHDAEVARLTAALQSAKSEVDEILRAALSGDCDRYLNYDLQGNKYCKWGVVSRDIAAVFDVTEPSDIDVSEQGFND